MRYDNCVVSAMFGFDELPGQITDAYISNVCVYPTPREARLHAKCEGKENNKLWVMLTIMMPDGTIMDSAIRYITYTETEYNCSPNKKEEEKQ